MSAAQVTEAHKKLACDVLLEHSVSGAATKQGVIAAAQLIADSEAAAVQIAMLREYGNLCATNESLAKERDQLRAAMERLKADGAASAFINMSCRASRAEAELAAERARLGAVIYDCWVIHKGNENACAVRSLGEYITHWLATPRAAIDAAMKEGAK